MPKCHFNKVANLRIWSHLRKKFLMENFIFCAVILLTQDIGLLVKNYTQNME